MKFSIERHKAHYVNHENYIARIKAELDRKQREYDEQIRLLGLYKAQIELAEKEKKDEFDSDKYAIKRLCV
jgi:hypothetical protein